MRVCSVDLFDRLRELRGNKSMVFSSHRFGNLTRHSDLILYVSLLLTMSDVRAKTMVIIRYMDESGIVESGTHDSLLKAEGEYARLWRLQAQAFV